MLSNFTTNSNFIRIGLLCVIISLSYVAAQTPTNNIILPLGQVTSFTFGNATELNFLVELPVKMTAEDHGSTPPSMISLISPLNVNTVTFYASRMKYPTNTDYEWTSFSSDGAWPDHDAFQMWIPSLTINTSTSTTKVNIYLTIYYNQLSNSSESTYYFNPEIPSILTKNGTSSLYMNLDVRDTISNFGRKWYYVSTIELAASFFFSASLCDLELSGTDIEVQFFYPNNPSSAKNFRDCYSRCSRVPTKGLPEISRSTGAEDANDNYAIGLCGTLEALLSFGNEGMYISFVYQSFVQPTSASTLYRFQIQTFEEEMTRQHVWPLRINDDLSLMSVDTSENNGHYTLYTTESITDALFQEGLIQNEEHENQHNGRKRDNAPHQRMKTEDKMIESAFLSYCWLSEHGERLKWPQEPKTTVLHSGSSNILVTYPEFYKKFHNTTDHINGITATYERAQRLRFLCFQELSMTHAYTTEARKWPTSAVVVSVVFGVLSVVLSVGVVVLLCIKPKNQNFARFE